MKVDKITRCSKSGVFFAPKGRERQHPLVRQAISETHDKVLLRYLNHLSLEYHNESVDTLCYWYKITGGTKSDPIELISSVSLFIDAIKLLRLVIFDAFKCEKKWGKYSHRIVTCFTDESRLLSLYNQVCLLETEIEMWSRSEATNDIDPFCTKTLLSVSAFEFKTENLPTYIIESFAALKTPFNAHKAVIGDDYGEKIKKEIDKMRSLLLLPAGGMDLFDYLVD
jgi:hypothetical protein